jgi:predicted GNAT family N-acyltransferase
LTTNLERPVVEIRAADWSRDEAALAWVRRRVFVDEQQVPEELEWDGEDFDAQHWLALIDDSPIGTVRLRAGGHIGRMAVLKEYRRWGVGTQLLSAVVAAARAQGLHEVHLHAQVQAIDFYARHGFVAQGEQFMDAGIPHREMRLQL